MAARTFRKKSVEILGTLTPQQLADLRKHLSDEITRLVRKGEI